MRPNRAAVLAIADKDPIGIFGPDLDLVEMGAGAERSTGVPIWSGLQFDRTGGATVRN